MTEDQVVNLMKSSKSEQEWNSNCDKVKKAFGGDYPDFWFKSIILSGVGQETARNFDKAAR